MKLRRIAFIFILILSVVLLVSCGKTGTKLTSIVFEGLTEKTVEFREEFNVLDGVRAKGNDGKYYDEEITFNSLSVAQGLIDEDGNLDTSVPMTHTVTYNVKVGAVESTRFRTIIVNGPEAVEGEMVVNSNFELGMAGWNDGAVNYNADGSSMNLSVVDEELVVQFEVGANMFTPRFGQAGITFEKGKTYKVMFKAKALENKNINLQVGELLPSDPYFIDFKPKQDERRLITTEWQEFSYKFTMNLDTNENGAILFEIGTVGTDTVSTTLFFDYIDVEESTPDADTAGPIFSGLLPEMNILLDSVFDPLDGVEAYDLVDGDVTDSIVVTITDEDNLEVSEVDTSKEGTYTLEYYAEDSKGNKTTFVVTLNVVDLIFKEGNLFKNGDFKAPLQVDDEKATWELWHQDWGVAPAVTLNHDTDDGFVELDIIGGGDAAWAVQFSQPEESGVILELGKTYKVTVEVEAEVERKFSLTLGYGDPYKDFGRRNGLTATTEKTAVEFVFTNTMETHDVKFVFELGSQEGFADGKFIIHSAKLEELDEEPILNNSNFDVIGWRGFSNDWDGSDVSFDVVNNEMKVSFNQVNGTGQGNWVVQLIQDALALGNPLGDSVGALNLVPGKEYTLTFDAYASDDAVIVPLVAHPGTGWHNIVNLDDQVELTTTKQTFTFTLDKDAIDGLELLKFEMGLAFGGDVTDEWIVISNVQINDEDNNNVVVNTSFTDVPFWNLFNDGVDADFEVTEDGLVVNVNSLGGAPHEPHLFQDGFDLAPGDYKFEVVLSSSVKRDIRFNLILPDAGYASILTDGSHDEEIEDEMTRVVIDITVANLVTNVKLEIDFGNLGEDLTSEETVITIESIHLYRVY